MTYQCGEEVLRSQPFSHVLMDDALSKVCDFCLRCPENDKSTALKCCSKCKLVNFCQKTCLENAWKSYHKQECKCLRKFSANKCNIPQDIVRLLARIIFKLQKGGGHEEFEILPNGRKRYFKDLMSHKEEIMKSADSLKGFRHIYSELQKYMVIK